VWLRKLKCNNKTSDKFIQELTRRWDSERELFLRDNRVNVCIHDTTGCQTGLYNLVCFTGWTNSCSFNTVVKPYLSNRLYNPFARPSVVCLSVCLFVCLLSVTFVHPTQPVEIVRNVCTLAIRWHPRKFYGDRPRGIPPTGELNARAVAKYSDFGPIECYISE